jgi:hypothetical protein
LVPLLLRSRESPLGCDKTTGAVQKSHGFSNLRTTRDAMRRGSRRMAQPELTARIRAEKRSLWQDGWRWSCISCAHTTAPSADPGATASVSPRATGGGVTEEPARCSHRLRAAQLGRPDALRRRRPAQDRQQRDRAGATTDRARPQKLAARGSEAAAHRTTILC